MKQGIVWGMLGMMLLGVGATSAWAADITVTGTVSDASATVTVKLDSNNPVTATKNGTTWSAMVGNATSGSHTITAKATNSIGDVAEKSISITVLTSLSLTIDSPKDGAFCGSNGVCTGGTAAVPAPAGSGGGGGGGF